MQKIAVEIVLPGTPRGKGRPRFSKLSGRAFTDAKTTSYESALRYAGLQAMAGSAPLEGPLDLTLIATVPVPGSWSKAKRRAAFANEIRPTSKPDGDNLAKMVDGLNQVVWKDDSQICDWRIRKFYSRIPALTIQVRAVDPSAWLQTLLEMPEHWRPELAELMEV